MANFHTHLTVAAVGSTALAGVMFAAGQLGATSAVLCAILGTLGGLLPDIDLDNSTPAKRGFFIASLVVSALLTIVYANRYTQDRLILDSLILWAVSFGVLRFGVLGLFSHLTVHRGMVHSVPYMAVFALAVVCGAFHGMRMTAFVSWTFGLFVFFGSMVHLLLDEVYSVNVLGVRLKRSFGTAFKWFEMDKALQYLALYGLVAALFYVAPPADELIKRLVNTAQFFTAAF
ncbi:hypothetical protein B0181_06420 [Moraxella caviae]|uniref:Hydrolase n=1 Tax=Moraxella caviae TaxID=34060 RepID=A0A1T0A1I1_9GAMM|nr:metal-dependent hydrolase [Moraxella caviae]OOR89600.1 hypothetical protein B0181_06420 [Moraxella caviae]STZ10284.1 Uncharacterised protein [Moraxella caviae]